MNRSKPSRHGLWLAAAPLLAIQQATAAPIEGEAASNVAALLVVLGVTGLFLGLRDLRGLRHKRVLPAAEHARPTSPRRRD